MAVAATWQPVKHNCRCSTIAVWQHVGPSLSLLHADARGTSAILSGSARSSEITGCLPDLRTAKCIWAVFTPVSMLNAFYSASMQSTAELANRLCCTAVPSAQLSQTGPAAMVPPAEFLRLQYSTEPPSSASNSREPSPDRVSQLASFPALCLVMKWKQPCKRKELCLETLVLGNLFALWCPNPPLCGD